MIDFCDEADTTWAIKTELTFSGKSNQKKKKRKVKKSWRERERETGVHKVSKHKQRRVLCDNTDLDNYTVQLGGRDLSTSLRRLCSLPPPPPRVRSHTFYPQIESGRVSN